MINRLTKTLLLILMKKGESTLIKKTKQPKTVNDLKIEILTTTLLNGKISVPKHDIRLLAINNKIIISEDELDDIKQQLDDRLKDINSISKKIYNSFSNKGLNNDEVETLLTHVFETFKDGGEFTYISFSNILKGKGYQPETVSHDDYLLIIELLKKKYSYTVNDYTIN